VPCRVYDVVMTHQLDADGFFIHTVQRACAERGLDFFLVEPLWVNAFLQALEREEVWPRAVLNLHSEHHLPQDPFHRLVELADRRKSFVVDRPEVAQAAFDKARLHPRLVEAGIQGPATITVARADAPDFRLSPEDRELLGTPFVVKPARGYGKRGVVMDAQSEADLARSIQAWPDERYLLQRRIVPRALDGCPAYWRLFYVFGHVWWCWWDCFTDGYREVTQEEIERHDLQPMGDGMRRLAALTGMNFFSSEIAQTATGEFVWIDYVNDQCHMLTQTANPKMGAPDRVVEAIAVKLVDGAAEAIRRPKALA
jgi:hypothetical protein